MTYLRKMCVFRIASQISTFWIWIFDFKIVCIFIGNDFIPIGSTAAKDLISVITLLRPFKKGYSYSTAYSFFSPTLLFFPLRAPFTSCDWWIKCLAGLELHKMPRRLPLTVHVKLLLTNPGSSGFIRKCHLTTKYILGVSFDIK